MAFTPCTSTLTKSIATACDVERVKGYEKLGIITKKSNIDFATSVQNALNPRIIENFALTGTNKFAVIYNSKKNPLPFNGTQTAFNRDADKYDKTVQFYFEGIGGGAAKDVVEPLKDDEYVIILPRKDKNGKGSFQIFGWSAGMSAGNDGGAQVQDEETGYWLITMTGQEKFAEYEFFDTDYETTKTAFDSFVNAALGE